ncbi:putative lipid II flippase FtsW [Halobacillus yeomjeoni]|uniref:Probable peptidoglycan glycosyltransferase FtsW n=1 Tax=Halobacillus yeomjeoni TaxID=311194 RepID=A0A931HTB4_9BACI|nr:putative lipid II flippase FtsW [Halobacillus yeomjeoni]MBH0229008.1 putative lipid II flippase FtsW [Halobacillus yeomjeoni]
MIRQLKTYDFSLLFAPIALVAFGTVMIYSASMVYGPVRFGVSSDHFLMKQLQWFVVGLFFMLGTSLIPYRHWQRLSKLSVLMMLIMLAGLFFFGTERNNAVSWYDLKVMMFQPAEFVKIGLIIYLASVYAKKQSYISDFSKAVVPPLVLTTLILVMIVLQPDIGSAAVIGLIASVVIITSGIKWKHIAILITVAALLIAIGAPQMVTDERLERFSGAYQPFESPDDQGYHLIQSYVAIGTGGVLGEGIGQGVQKLGYLPEPHTDFIMAVIAEELGFIGVSITIGLLGLIVLRGLYISSRCRDAFGALMAIGISSMIAIQAAINLGAMSGLLPITGVTLPFVSYGGSSLLFLMIAVGILNNIARTVKQKEQEDGEEIPIEEMESSKNQRINRGVRSWQN